MRLTHITPGISSGNSRVSLFELPELPNIAHNVDAIEVLRGSGNLLTDGDTVMVGLSHQKDILAPNGDQDDFLLVDSNREQIWWSTGLVPNDRVFDVFPFDFLIAGPQALIFLNDSGGTTAIRITMHYHEVKISQQDWTLLKLRTSFEAVA